MTNAISILPIKHGSIDAYDRAELRKAGIVVVEHDHPEELRLITPSHDIPYGGMLRCAMLALNSNTMASAATGQREHFMRLLVNEMIKDKP